MRREGGSEPNDPKEVILCDMQKSSHRKPGEKEQKWKLEKVRTDFR